MKIKTFILFFLTCSLASYAQEINSKADHYFYSYAYGEAIAAYQKDMASGKLITNHQLLNLADSYFRMGNFKKASELYLDINQKDSIMSNHHINKMLQSLSKTSESARVKAFLKAKSPSLSSNLLENAAFNFEVLEGGVGNSQTFDVFNISSNSPQADISPAFFKDKLLFSSARTSKTKQVYGPSGESYLDIYVGRIGKDGNVLNPNVFGRMPESEYHKSTPYYSEKLDKTFYILSNSENGELAFDDNGKNALAIGMVYDNGFFAFLLRDLSTSFYYPYFDETTERLYFAANFKDGYGGTDIYYVSTNNGQIMSEPVNLGPTINSPGNEISPYILEESFYFSSDVFYGFGGMDIYKSNMLQDQTFSIPVNLGASINTDADEFGFIIRTNNSEGFSGYFASNRKGGKGNDDIYGFRTATSNLGPKTISIRGEVVEPQYQQGIQDVKVSLLDAEGNSLKEVYTNSDGEYRLEIPWREKISLEITKEGHSSYNKSYSGEALDELQQTTLTVQMLGVEEMVTERENKIVLNLNDFFFARGKNDVTPAISLELDKVADFVQKFPNAKLQIETHTDSRGGSNTNKALSQKRADRILAYLSKKGVSSENVVSAIGYGEERIMNNCTNGIYCLDFLHKQNMRTLFVIQNYDQLK